jgi:hypothetical protein
MGLVTPLTIIYDWLDEAGYALIEELANDADESVASSD